MLRSTRLPEVLQVLVAEADRVVAWRLGATLVLVVAGGLLSGLAPLALKGLVDAVAAVPDPQDRTAIRSAMTLGALYLLALCGGRLLAEIRPLVASTAEHRLFTRLRQRFFAHLLGLPLAFHLDRRTGALVQTLQQATTGYQLIVVHLVDSVVPVVVEVITVVVVLVHLGQGALMATFVVTALAYVAVFALGTAGLKRRAKEVSDASLDTQATLMDSLLNCETLKCFNAETTARERLSKNANVLERRWLGLYGLRARVGLVQTATFTVSTIASLWLAAEAVAHGTLSVGGFVLANVYMLQVVRPLEMLGVAMRDLAQAAAFIRPLLDVLREPMETPPSALRAPEKASDHCADGAASGLGATGKIGSPQRGPRIRFRGVHFGYGSDRPVLRNLELDIAAGATVAIVGASGSGKSSLARLLLRFYDPVAGQIWLDQTPLDRLSIGELRGMIGLVPQDVALFNDTIAANIGIAMSGAQRRDIERAARIAHVHDFVSRLPAGYDTPVGERGLKLSGGERQRVAIARAILRRPRIYVLDEATSMLDSRTEAAVLRELREAAAGCTTLSIAHRLSTARHADEIVVLEEGRIAERGGHASLLANSGSYARLWRSQLRGDLA